MPVRKVRAKYGERSGSRGGWRKLQAVEMDGERDASGPGHHGRVRGTGRSDRLDAPRPGGGSHLKTIGPGASINAASRNGEAMRGHARSVGKVAAAADGEAP